MATQVPSRQANWSGPHVTVHPQKENEDEEPSDTQFITLTNSTEMFFLTHTTQIVILLLTCSTKPHVHDQTLQMLILPPTGQTASSVPDGQSLSPSHTFSAGTHWAPGHWNSVCAQTQLENSQQMRSWRMTVTWRPNKILKLEAQLGFIIICLMNACISNQNTDGYTIARPSWNSSVCHYYSLLFFFFPTKYGEYRLLIMTTTKNTQIKQLVDLETYPLSSLRSPQSSWPSQWWR